MDTFDRVITLLLPVITCVVLLIIPHLTRPGLFFGVTIDPPFRRSTEGRRIHRRYSTAVCISGAMVIAILIAMVVTDASMPRAIVGFGKPGTLSIIAMVQFVTALIAFIQANQATRPHAQPFSSLVTVALTRVSTPTTSITLALTAPFISLIVLAVWTRLRWESLPATLVVHWSLAGPDRWVPTTPSSVATLLTLSATLCLLCGFVGWALFNGSRRIATSGEAAQTERRFRMRTVYMLLAVECLVVLPPWVALLDLSPTVIKTVFAVGVGTLLLLSARLLLAGQGGSYGLDFPNDAPTDDRTADRYWRFGLIYFNRDDPSFLVDLPRSHRSAAAHSSLSALRIYNDARRG